MVSRVLSLSEITVNSPALAPRRWPAPLISLAIHAAAAALLLSSNRFLPATFPTPEYKLVVVPLPPKDKPINGRFVWSPIPEVAPLNPFGPEDTPHGEKDPSKRVLIAQAQAPDSTKQFIQQPEHPEPLPTDVPTPNLVSARVENPPVPAKPVPKVFVPPPPAPTPVRSAEPRPVILEPPPSVEPSKVQARNDLGQYLAPVAKMKFKPASATVPSAAAPAVTPMRDAPPAPPSDGALSSKMIGTAAVIVSLNPGVGPPPPGSRSAQFAKAPASGTPSSGAAQPGAVTVPGLVARGRPLAPVKPPSFPPAGATSNRKVVKEIAIESIGRTMSAPLRPSARIIPPSVESQFSNRNVYTLAIPGPELPEYTGDWVMWFSERQPADDPRQRISAPIPARKYATVDEAAGTLVAATIQFAAVLDKSGRVALLRVIRGRVDEWFKLKAMQELEAWDFQPALRNGEPIEVDMVLEIPFQLKMSLPASK